MAIAVSERERERHDLMPRKRGEESVCKRTGISSLSRESHEGVLVELSCLVIGGFQDGDTSHGSFGSCH